MPSSIRNAKVGSKFCRILDEPTIFLPNWRNSAKSGHPDPSNYFFFWKKIERGIRLSKKNNEAKRQKKKGEKSLSVTYKVFPIGPFYPWVVKFLKMSILIYVSELAFLCCVKQSLIKVGQSGLFIVYFQSFQAKILQK